MAEGSAHRRDLYLTTITKDKRPCLRRDSNPQSQQPTGRRPTPQTPWSLGAALLKSFEYVPTTRVYTTTQNTVRDTPKVEMQLVT